MSTEKPPQSQATIGSPTIGKAENRFVITVAAAESAIGLGLLVVYYRVRGTIAMDWVNVLKG